MTSQAPLARLFIRFLAPVAVALGSLALFPSASSAEVVQGTCSFVNDELNDAEWNTQNIVVQYEGQTFLYPLAGAPLDASTLTVADFEAAIDAAQAAWGTDIYYQITFFETTPGLVSYQIEIVGPSPIVGRPNGNVDWNMDTDQCEIDVPDAGIDIEKSTNDVDADTPEEAPVVTIGDPVTWTYMVTNTGDTYLTDVVVTDSIIAAADIDCGEGSNVFAGPLAPTASFVCTATGVAVEGPYANVGSTTGTPAEEDGSAIASLEPPTDEDPSHYTGAPVPVAGIDIEKSTNGVDADTADLAPVVAAGDTVTWSYTVTNTGDTYLTNVTVTDSVIAAADIDCGKGTNVFAGPLAPAASFTCTATGVAVEGPYMNIGLTTGTPTDDAGTAIVGLEPPTDEDPSHYTGEPVVVPEAGIDIEKATNGIDADAPLTGPTLASDESVTWTYVVTNTADTAIAGVVVADNKGVLISCLPSAVDAGGDNVIDVLLPGEVVECSATGGAEDGAYGNIGTVTGAPQVVTVDCVCDPADPSTWPTDPMSFEPIVDDAGDPLVVDDEDPSHYQGITPAIDIEKATNGMDADEAPGVGVAVGDAVTWTYVVTNTGNSTLLDVEVTDSQGVAVDCGSGMATIAMMLPGDSVTCSGTGIAVAGDYSNIGEVSGTPVLPVGDGVDPFDPTTWPTDPSGFTEIPGAEPVKDEDPSNYYGVEAIVDPPPASDVSLTKTVVTVGPYLPGQTVEYLVAVTNDGPGEATNVEVTDALPAGLAYQSDSLGGTSTGSSVVWLIDRLSVNETVAITVFATISLLDNPGSLTNFVEVTGMDQTDIDSAPGEGPLSSDSPPNEDDESMASIDVDIEELAFTGVGSMQLVALAMALILMGAAIVRAPSATRS